MFSQGRVLHGGAGVLQERTEEDLPAGLSNIEETRGQKEQEKDLIIL